MNFKKFMQNIREDNEDIYKKIIQRRRDLINFRNKEVSCDFVSELIDKEITDDQCIKRLGGSFASCEAFKEMIIENSNERLLGSYFVDLCLLDDDYTDCALCTVCSCLLVSQKAKKSNI